MSNVVGFAYENGVLYTCVETDEGEKRIQNEVLSRVIHKQAEKMGMAAHELAAVLDAYMRQPEGFNIVPHATSLTPAQFEQLKGFLGLA